MESQNHVNEDKMNTKEKYEEAELKECGTIKEDTNTNYSGSGTEDYDSWQS